MIYTSKSSNVHINTKYLKAIQMHNNHQNGKSTIAFILTDDERVTLSFENETELNIEIERLNSFISWYNKHFKEFE